MRTRTLIPSPKAVMPAAPSLDLESWMLLLVLSLLWGASFLFMRVAGEEIPVFTLVLARVGIAALALHAVILATGRRYPSEPRIWGRALLMGALNNAIPFSLIIFAVVRIGAGAGSILNATTPIFALLVAHFLTSDEKMTPRRLAGVVLGFAGVAAMIGPTALSGVSGELLAALAMLAASNSYAFAAVVGKGFRDIDPVVTSALQLTASTILIAPFALLAEAPLGEAMPSATAILATLAFALFSTALAYVLYFRILARAGGTNVILVTLLVPVSAVALGALLLGERLTLAEFAGMGLIGAGLLVMDGRVVARLRRGWGAGA